MAPQTIAFLFAKNLDSLASHKCVGQMRRVCVLTLAVLVCVSIPHKSVSGQGTDKIHLRGYPAPRITQQVRVILEVRGKLKLNADGAEVRELPFEVNGNLDYEERWLPKLDKSSGNRALRYYQTATADMRVGSAEFTHALRDSERLVAASMPAGQVALTSLKAPLTQEELDLLNVQGSSLALEGLLPDQEVSIGEEWQLARPELARLLCLDLVTKSDVSMKLVQVEEQTAIIEGEGNVEGMAGGVESSIRLKAKVNADLHDGRVTWLAASLAESRAIGHAEPGFDVTARLRVAIKRLPEPGQLTDALVAQYQADTQDPSIPLVFESNRAYFRVFHDRRWRSMVDRHDLCIFRLVDQGDLIAQCNISPLPNRGDLGALTLEEFQLDVQKALGQQFGQIAEASQEEGQEGQKIFRVVVEGTASEVPVKWTYYHVADRDGRRAALAFTYESKLQETFGNLDRAMVDSFEFLPMPEPAEAQSSSSS